MTEQQLRDTFRAHECLADPERAVTLAGVEGPRPRRWPALAAIAAVAVVIASSVAIGHTGHEPSSPGDSGTAAPTTAAPSPVAAVDPLGRPIRTDSENQANVDQLVARALNELAAAAPPGTRTGRPADLGVLKDMGLATSNGTPHLVFWQVPASARDLAQWFADHPLAGFTIEGERPTDKVMESGGGGQPWSWSAIFDPGPAMTGPGGTTSYQIETADVGGQALARITVYANVLPARPSDSFVWNPTAVSIEVRSFAFDRHGRRKGSTLTRYASPAGLSAQQAASVVNRLYGWEDWFHSCPAYRLDRTVTLVFQTPRGEYRLRKEPGCYGTWKALLDGHEVGPILAGSTDLDDLVARFGVPPAR